MPCSWKIIIIAQFGVLSEDEWGDLQCLYKACQATVIDGGFFTDTGLNENESDEMKKRWLDHGAREPTRVGTNRLRGKGLIKDKGFEFKVKLMRGEGK